MISSNSAFAMASGPTHVQFSRIGLRRRKSLKSNKDCTKLLLLFVFLRHILFSLSFTLVIFYFMSEKKIKFPLLRDIFWLFARQRCRGVNSSPETFGGAERKLKIPKTLMENILSHPTKYDVLVVKKKKKKNNRTTKTIYNIAAITRVP